MCISVCVLFSISPATVQIQKYCNIQQGSQLTILTLCHINCKWCVSYCSRLITPRSIMHPLIASLCLDCSSFIFQFAANIRSPGLRALQCLMIIYILDSKDVTSFWICSILWMALSRWHHCSMKLFSRKQLVKLPYFSYHRYFTRSWTFSASQTALSAKWSACWPSSKQPRQIRLVKLSRHLFNYTRALYVNRAWLALKLTGHTSRGAQEERLFSGKAAIHRSGLAAGCPCPTHTSHSGEDAHWQRCPGLQEGLRFSMEPVF